MDRALARCVLVAHAPDGVRWASGYPTDGSLACAAAVIAADDAGRTDPFGAFCILDADGVTIGDLLVHAPPDAQGAVDIGYGLVPSARGRGLATAAVIALIGWAFADPSVRRVTANTIDDNVRSIGVMRRAGMHVSHGPGGLVRGVAIRGIWGPGGSGPPDDSGAGH